MERFPRRMDAANATGLSCHQAELLLVPLLVPPARLAPLGSVGHKSRKPSAGAGERTN